MSCGHVESAGAYVLGALSPRERLEFEQHYEECATCSAAVRELAGMPGLLARADPSVLEGDGGPHQEPVPASVLPTLMAQTRRTRRTRVGWLAGAAAAALLGIGGAGVAVGVAVGHEGGMASSAPTTGRSVAMQPVQAAPARATVAMAARPWGTELHLTCAYAEGRDRYRMPPAVTYLLVVRGRDGAAQNVGTWQALRGRTMQLTAATALSMHQIGAVEVRTEQGRTVLRTPSL